jgi:integrase
MATIQKRKNKNGTTSYRVMIRPNDGLPATYKTLPTYQEAKDWAIQEEARRRQGIYFPERTPATVNRYLASLSLVLSYAVKECGWLEINPMLRVSKLKEPRGRDRILSKEECERLLLSCAQSKSPYLLPIVTLAISTGMRRGEILQLTWDNVDLEKGLISLKETKSGHPRSIPLVGEALAQFNELFRQRNLYNPFVFPSKKRFGEISIRKAWDEALIRAGIKNLRFHDLRHTFATYAAKAGASNLELATAMGHQTLQMLQRYTHLDVNHTRKLSEFVSSNLLSGSTHGTD